MIRSEIINMKITIIGLLFLLGDLPPENETSFMLDWEIRKGALNGQERLCTEAIIDIIGIPVY